MEDMQQMDQTKAQELPVETIPNHNPVIGSSRKDTLKNTIEILSIVQERFLITDGNGTEFDEQTTAGYACLLSCVMDALNFELKYRDTD